MGFYIAILLTKRVGLLCFYFVLSLVNIVVQNSLYRKFNSLWHLRRLFSVTVNSPKAILFVLRWSLFSLGRALVLCVGVFLLM